MSPIRKPPKPPNNGGAPDKPDAPTTGPPERPLVHNDSTVPFPPAAPLPVGPETPFRALGDVPERTWREQFRALGSPFDDVAVDACYRAARPVSALVLHLGIVESMLGRATPAANNWLGLRVPGSLRFQDFASPVACIGELMRRWQDPGYKGGVYMPAELSLRAMYHKYAPPYENPTEDLIATCVVRVNKWRAGEDAPPPPRPEYDFGPHPWPAGFDRNIVPKGPSGQGWDALGDRSPGMCAVVWHITDGYDDRDAIVRLFGPGGERYRDALTEAVIDRSGRGYLMNDPWSADPMEGSGRTPWASGPANGLEGPGIAFVRALGANAANHRGFAIEHCNKEGQRFDSDAQLDLSAKVSAVAISRMRIPWDAWPRNPNVGDLYVAMKHRDFAAKSCPGWVWDEGFHRARVEAVRIEAKKLQTGSDVPPDPVAPPVPPVPDWPFDFSPEQVATFWGAAGGLRRQGTAGRFPFDPAGPISVMWLARARQEGRFPAALEWWADASGWNFVSFGDQGDVDWLLAIPSLAGRADWRWVDKPPEGVS